MTKTTELWQVGIVHRPLSSFTTADALAGADITWLPDAGSFRFNADPFGIAHEGKFTVFVEALDYRIKRGEIHYYTYDAAWNLIARGTALKKPFHLSYPTIIREGGEIYLLPEAHKSGKLTLYRATRFPDGWEEVATLLDSPAIDASVIQHEGKWWMFYALPGTNGRAMHELHIAHAESLMGPWLPHTSNPVRTGLDSARPGGLPFMANSALHLPTQDCTDGYGSAINLLRIDTLTPTDFSASIVNQVSPTGIHPHYVDGLHTLSGDGDITLIDVKRNDTSRMRKLIDMQRRVRRLLGAR